MLTAATMNTYRIKHTPKEKIFLDQRSAATLIADQLRTNNGDPLKLVVYDDTIDEQPVTVDAAGKITRHGEVTERHVARFEIVIPEGTSMSPLQRTVYECAIQKFMDKEIYAVKPGETKPKAKISFQNFKYGDSEVGDPSGLWLAPIEVVPSVGEAYKIYGGAVNIHDPDKNIPDFQANFGCMNNDKNRMYDYTADFDNSQLKVTMYASIGTNEILGVEELVKTVGSTPDDVTWKMVSTDSTQTIISWDSPVIAKYTKEDVKR